MKFSQLKQLILICTVAAAHGLALGTAFLIERSQVAATHSAEAAVDRTAKAVESIVNRQLLQADSVLARIPSLLGNHPRRQDNASEAENASALLQLINLQNAAFFSLHLADANGHAWASARGVPHKQTLPRLDQLAASPGSSSIVGPIRHLMTDDWT